MVERIWRLTEPGHLVLRAAFVRRVVLGEAQQQQIIIAVDDWSPVHLARRVDWILLLKVYRFPKLTDEIDERATFALSLLDHGEAPRSRQGSAPARPRLERGHVHPHR